MIDARFWTLELCAYVVKRDARRIWSEKLKTKNEKFPSHNFFSFVQKKIVKMGACFN